MTVSRRSLLIGLSGLAGVAVASCGSADRPSRPASVRSNPSAPAPAPTRHAYGGDPSQFGDLYRATGTPQAGTIVVIHGGFWLDSYGLSLGAPLAADLARRGYTAFNLEYRRVGDGGGWPVTALDIAAGIDRLADLDVDTSRVIAIGHSAGGQLAAWAAARNHFAAGKPGAGPRVAVTAVVAQAGVLDLATAQRQGVGGAAVANFIGGSADQYPTRYADADPIEQLPLTAPVLCVHSRTDQNVPFAQSTAYVTAAQARGGRVTLSEVDGDHFTLIDPGSAAWAVVVAALPELLAG